MKAGERSNQMLVSRFVERFDIFIRNPDPNEVKAFQLLLASAIASISKEGHVPTEPHMKTTFNALIELVSRIRPTGLIWYGHPDFISSGLLNDLRKESESLRKHARRTTGHYLVPAGETATKLANSELVKSFMSATVGHEVDYTGVGTYLFYENEGDGLFAHVDTEIFTVNLIIGLIHEVPPNARTKSSLIVHPVNGEPRRLDLLEKAAILNAAGTVHGREPIGKGERITNLTLGYSMR